MDTIGRNVYLTVILLLFCELCEISGKPDSSDPCKNNKNNNKKKCETTTTTSSVKTTKSTKTSTTSAAPTSDVSSSLVNHENTTTPISSSTTPKHTTKELATSVPATSNTRSISVEDEETTRESTTKPTTDSTNWSDTSQPGTSNTLGLADDSDSVVAVAVSVSVLTVIAIAAVIAFLFWRRGRLKSIPAKESYHGTSITNRNYEDGHGLDRHVSLLIMRTKDSVDSAYAEIPLEHLHPEEMTGNVYQTIDSFPEDQAESNGGYGHLKIQTTQFVNENYSHFPLNQTSEKASTDITYAHTGSAINEQVLNDNRVDVDTTYNRLETIPQTNHWKQVPQKKEEENDDAETEYNHAKAGLADLKSENKTDTYSHLNSNWQKVSDTPQNGLKLHTPDSKMEMYESNQHGSVKEYGSQTYESGNANDGNNIPEYAECKQNGKECGRLEQVGPDGYETAVGSSHNYFILEPENEVSSKEVSFRVVDNDGEETAQNSESAETPYHPYFILEKSET